MSVPDALNVWGRLDVPVEARQTYVRNETTMSI